MVPVEEPCGIEIQRLGPFVLIAVECQSEQAAASLLQQLVQDRRLSLLLHDLSQTAVHQSRH